MSVSYKSKLFIKVLLSLMSLTFLTISIIVLYTTAKHITISELVASVNTVSPKRLILALLVCLFNYCIMIGYDWFGLRYAGSNMPFRKVAFAAIVGDTLNNNLGLSAIVGSTIKFRIYSFWGEKAGAIARSIGFYTIGYWMGFAVLTALALWFCSIPIPYLPSFGPIVNRILALAVALPVIIFLMFLFQKKIRHFSFGRFSLRIPSIDQGVGILLIGIIDWASTGVLFYLLMPVAPLSQIFQFISIYTVSHLAGMISQVPGGLAVFESAAVLMFKNSVNSNLLASLLLFRVIFFIVPFIFGLAGFILFEFKTGSKFLYRFFFRTGEPAKSCVE